MSYVDMVEPDEMDFLVPHIHDLFESGRALTWIEVMGMLRHLHAAVEILKTLRRWTERAKRAGKPQDILENIETIKAWTIDLEHVVAEYHTCLKAYPNEIYYLSATLFPRNRPIRKRLETLTSRRGQELPVNFSERKDWEPFKCIRMPSSITGDPHFISNDLNRFTFNPEGSLIAFRGSRQVNILSAHTGASVCTFQFPNREPVSVIFAHNSSALAVSFSNAESQLIDIRTGNLIQKLPSSYRDSLSLPTTPLSHRGHQLEIPAGTEELSFVATLSEERTSAAGPNGIYASLNSQGFFNVSDQTGNTVYSRQIRMERELQGGQSDSGTGMAAAVKGKLGLPSSNSPNVDGDVKFKCYDIGTRMAEDIVISRLLSQLKSCDEKRYPPQLIILNGQCGEWHGYQFQQHRHRNLTPHYKCIWRQLRSPPRNQPLRGQNPTSSRPLLETSSSDSGILSKQRRRPNCIMSPSTTDCFYRSFTSRSRNLSD